MIKIALRNSDFIKNIGTLVSGTALAQLAPIIVTPVLTRLYTPEEFGYLALYIAIGSILSMVVTGRYELAILVPKTDKVALNVMALSVTLSLLVSLVLLIFIVVFSEAFVAYFNISSPYEWLYLVPFSTAIVGIYQSYSYWCNRKAKYKDMALSRVVQSGSVSASQLGLGYLNLGLWGLLIGHIVGQTLSLLYLVSRGRNNRKEGINVLRIKGTAKKYKKFPKYLILAHTINATSSQSPSILISTLYNTTITGFFLITQRVLQVPISLISGAIGEVFRQKASSQYASTGTCRDLFVRMLLVLIFVSIVPFMTLYLYIQDIFNLFLGEDWSLAGEYAKILLPVYFMRFVSSPLSSMFIIAEAQKLDLIWQVLLQMMVIMSFVIGYFFDSVEIALILFSSTYVIMFLINIFISYNLSGPKNDKIC
ncbi:lipopolysaccharide biosynthesis protein [Vibrio mediterranei]|uniref:Uncharacterized protein n=1 Tax=Vibrio mediterranei TaxID=689 RepID=A0ABX5DCS5_9VIBR|nr:lipopolysaccharide biosynthesis protein [Vibrio mediterranei]PCD87718.1 hypothetical protein COR52_15085 [Vibrio mediterranei]PRQ67342.1 hypothetical protein COR51_12270 [Vibrio mediterranei]